jgi:HEAT repeat protein
VPTIRDRRHVMNIIALSVLLIPLISLPAAMESEAQTEPTQETGPESQGEVAARNPFDASTRSAAAAARREFESALEDDEGNTRWNALRAARHLSEPWIADLVLPICDSPDLLFRVLALEVVTNTNPELGRAEFLEALISGERSLRLRGLHGLAAIGDAETVPSLVQILKEDPDPDLRAEAARALGGIGDARASIPLYEAIESRFPPVREQAVISLLAIGDEGVGDYLIGKLQAGHDPGEPEILRLLALIPDPALVGQLEPYLKHEDDEFRTLAAAAIFGILERARRAQR